MSHFWLEHISVLLLLEERQQCLLWKLKKKSDFPDDQLAGPLGGRTRFLFRHRRWAGSSRTLLAVK